MIAAAPPRFRLRRAHEPRADPLVAESFRHHQHVDIKSAPSRLGPQTAEGLAGFGMLKHDGEFAIIRRADRLLGEPAQFRKRAVVFGRGGSSVSMKINCTA